MKVEWLGRCAYGPTWARQRGEREAVLGGEPARLWLLEHEPVITLGRRGGIVDREAAAAQGFEVVQSDRGGLATCHEPGQIVGYLIMDVRRVGVRRVVEALEAGLIRWLATQGVEAGRREGLPGVWVGGAKIGAVGLNANDGVTTHGFALNLVNDLRGFSLIVPCGIGDAGVTSLARVSGRALTPADASKTIAHETLDALQGVQ